MANLSYLVSSGRDKKPKGVIFSEECAFEILAFRVEMFTSLERWICWKVTFEKSQF